MVWKNKFGGQVILPKLQLKATHDAKALGSGSTTMLFGYIPPWKANAPKVVIQKNEKYMLVNPIIPPCVHITANIMPNMEKLTFTNNDLRKFSELHMSKYMTSVQRIEGGSIELVPMDWARGLEHFGICL